MPEPHSPEDLALTAEMLAPTTAEVAPEYEDDKDAGLHKPMTPPEEEA